MSKKSVKTKIGIILITLVVLFAIVVTGPHLRNALRTVEQVRDDSWPEVIRFGILPEETPSILAARYEPFLEHIQQSIGIPVELYFGHDYRSLITAMQDMHIHAAKFGPFAYIQAAREAGAIAFAQGVSDAERPYYYSLIIVHKDSGITEITDLIGTRFAWVDPASASGYLFPRSYLIGELATPDHELDALFTNIGFSGTHDSSIQMVINREIDAASVSDSQMDRMRAANHDGIDSIHILARTQPIPRSPQAYHESLPDSLQKALREAHYSFNDPDFLAAHNYDAGFVPVEDAAYNVVREVAERITMDERRNDD